VLLNVAFFVFQASLHAIRVAGFECRHVTGEHFQDVLNWLRPSISSKELQHYQVDDSFK